MCCSRIFIVSIKEVTVMLNRRKNIETDIEVSVIIVGVIYAMLLILAIAQATGTVL